jgi:hypothetical protein
MTGRDLTPDQTRRLQRHVGRRLRFLNQSGCADETLGLSLIAALLYFG